MVWWIPLVIAAAAAVAKKKGNANKPQPQPVPTYRSPSDMGIPQFNPDGSVNPLWQFMSTGMMPGFTSTSDTSGFSSTATDSTTKTSGKTTTKPIYDAASQGVVDLIPNLLKQRIVEGGKVQPAEKAGVVGGITRDARAAEAGLINRLTDMGFLGSPVEVGAREALGRGTLGALANYETQIPTIERGRANEDVGLVSSVLANLFKGQQTDMSSTSRTTGTSDTSYGSSTTNTQPPTFNPSALNLGIYPNVPNPLQPNWWDSLGDMTSMIAMMYGMGAFNKNKATKTAAASKPTTVSGNDDWLKFIQMYPGVFGGV